MANKYVFLISTALQSAECEKASLGTLKMELHKLHGHKKVMSLLFKVFKIFHDQG